MTQRPYASPVDATKNDACARRLVVGAMLAARPRLRDFEATA